MTAQEIPFVLDQRKLFVILDQELSISTHSSGYWWEHNGPWPVVLGNADEKPTSVRADLVAKVFVTAIHGDVSSSMQFARNAEKARREAEAYRRVWADQQEASDEEHQHILRWRTSFEATVWSEEHSAKTNVTVLVLDRHAFAVDEYIHASRPLSNRERLSLARTYAIAHLRALPLLHRKNVVAGDVRTENTLVSFDSARWREEAANAELLLCDFGNSTIQDMRTDPIDGYLHMEGTRYFQRSRGNDEPRDDRDDYFALGVSLYELIHDGQLPFTDGSGRRYQRDLAVRTRWLAQEAATGARGTLLDIETGGILGQAPDLARLLRFLLGRNSELIPSSRTNAAQLVGHLDEISANLTAKHETLTPATERAWTAATARAPRRGERNALEVALDRAASRANAHDRRQVGATHLAQALTPVRHWAQGGSVLRNIVKQRFPAASSAWLFYPLLVLMPFMVGGVATWAANTWWEPVFPGAAPKLILKHPFWFAVLVGSAVLLSSLAAARHKLSPALRSFTAFFFATPLFIAAPYVAWTSVEVLSHHLDYRRPWSTSNWAPTQRATAGTLVLALFLVISILIWSRRARRVRVALALVTCVATACAVLTLGWSWRRMEPVTAAGPCSGAIYPTFVASDRLCVQAVNGWTPATSSVLPGNGLTLKRSDRQCLQAVIQYQPAVSLTSQFSQGQVPISADSRAAYKWPTVLSLPNGDWFYSGGGDSQPTHKIQFDFASPQNKSERTAARIVISNVQSDCAAPAGFYLRDVTNLVSAVHVNPSDCLDARDWNSSKGSSAQAMAFASRICLPLKFGNSLNTGYFADMPDNEQYAGVFLGTGGADVYAVIHDASDCGSNQSAQAGFVTYVTGSGTSAQTWYCKKFGSEATVRITSNSSGDAQTSLNSAVLAQLLPVVGLTS